MIRSSLITKNKQFPIALQSFVSFGFWRAKVTAAATVTVAVAASFGYAFKSLADLTCETTIEQKADKPRRDAAQIIKD